ncbi:putative Fe-S protein [Jannaschia seosinensis]|uniref:Putative Fe-S protein n=1 Tax=Jannaschia seosinensis TaxID=313367 RepID=A0A0M7BFS4_9RHOB|nr:MOSC domain-containing protein [Jannaschia seosinensis]CUH40763.1 putative Fe-S protein [Jannaschia seosinensis]
MRVDAIWRHPIKAHGREALAAFDIAAGATIPLDREWAVVHEAARMGPTEQAGDWAPCANFNRGAKTPALMAVTARMAGDHVILSHPDRPDLIFDPDEDNRPFLDWIAPLSDPSRARPSHIVRARGRGYTDSPFASISLHSIASLTALETRIGRSLSRDRFRGNLWIDGAEPWAEFDWIGREMTIGTATFRAEERITRCRATMTDPETGHVDADTLGALEAGWGHRDFGVYLTCTAPGHVARGDALVLR